MAMEPQGINVGSSERVASGVAGGALALVGLSLGSRLGALLALVGGGLALRGVTGTCPIYHALGKSTAEDDGTTARSREVVDESSDESFPASDPPSWTPNTSFGPDRR